jgi:autotransporter adhesin
MDVLLKQKRLTGFSGGEAVSTAAEGIPFPLEREEAVETCAAGTVAGAEASEAIGTGLLMLDLAFLGGGSTKPLSLQAYKLDKMRNECRWTLSGYNLGVRSKNLHIKKVVFIGKTAGRSL